jgi:hypothetical protein
MAIKNQMAFWIPLDVESALNPKSIRIQNDFLKLEHLCLGGEETFNAPDSGTNHVDLAHKILVLSESLANFSFKASSSQSEQN